jgi:hypothetical protein
LVIQNWAVMKDLFDSLPDPTERSQYGAVEVNRTVPAAAVPRLTKQCLTILDLLRGGRQTNARLCRVGLNYRARVSELRQAGYDVRNVDHNHASGESWYALFVNGQEVGGR